MSVQPSVQLTCNRMCNCSVQLPVYLGVTTPL
jgi:hypothetical protein